MPVPGALIQGSDGSVYFLPQVLLNKHKIVGDGADAAAEVFGDDEVAGFNFSTSLNKMGTFTLLRAFEGPFGIAPKAMNIGEEPTEADSATIRSIRR